MTDQPDKPLIQTRMEFMLTLECKWGCRDCCRGLESTWIKGSHVTPVQAVRFMDELRDKQVYVKRLKVHGGEPMLNPDFSLIIKLLAEEIGPWEHGKLFGKIKVQTAYPRKAVETKHDIPWNGTTLQLHCEPVDDRNFKDHHVPWFVSPVDAGYLKLDETPPYGTALTGKACELQSRCGRSFEAFGFTACAQESVIGRAIGVEVCTSEYKHWGDPEVCRHCPMSLGKEKSRELQMRAKRGELEHVTQSLKMLEATPDNIVQLKAAYSDASEKQQRW